MSNKKWTWTPGQNIAYCFILLFMGLFIVIVVSGVLYGVGYGCKTLLVAMKRRVAKAHSCSTCARTRQRRLNARKAQYRAWAKLTGNSQKLTFSEWRVLPRNPWTGTILR